MNHEGYCWLGNIEGSHLSISTAGVVTAAGFTIGTSALHTANKTTFADNDAGIYLGSDGIHLGASGAFKVDDAGAANASNLNITGGGININSSKFVVDTSGNLLTEGDCELRGTVFIAPEGGAGSANDVGLYINKTNTAGETDLQIGGPNCSIKNGTSNGSNPLGTPKYKSYRNTVGNGNYIQMLTGNLNDLTSNLIMGFANRPNNSELSDADEMFRIGNTGLNIYDASSPYGRHDSGTGDAGWPFIMHKDENKIGINLDNKPAYQLDVAGTIRATGNVIAYSDIRKKKKIKTIDSALDKVNALRGVEFEWKTAAEVNGENKKKAIKKAKKKDPKAAKAIGWDGISDANWDRPELKTRLGVIAQEIEKVVPEVVFEDPNDGYKSVSYGNLTALLIEAIKEQSEEINNLKEQVKELQNGTTK
jgi:hypothetical protein